MSLYLDGVAGVKVDGGFGGTIVPHGLGNVSPVVARRLGRGNVHGDATVEILRERHHLVLAVSFLKTTFLVLTQRCPVPRPALSHLIF